MKKSLILSVLLILVHVFFTSCDKEELEYGDFNYITYEEWPHTDCSTSTGPVRDIVAYKLLGVSYEWEKSFDLYG